MDSADPKTHCTVFFLPVTGDPPRTDVHLLHTGWRSGREWQEARDWYAESWEIALEKLQELING